MNIQGDFQSGIPQVKYWIPRAVEVDANVLVTGLDEVVSRRRLVVERSATAVPHPGATPGTCTRRAPAPGALLLFAVSSDVVAKLL